MKKYSHIPTALRAAPLVGLQTFCQYYTPSPIGTQTIKGSYDLLRTAVHDL